MNFDNNCIFRPSSDLSRHENKVIWIFILFLLVMFMFYLCGWRWFYQAQKRIWTYGTDLCLLNSVLRCLELYEIYLVVWHGVLLVFFFTMRDFWIASENHVMYKKIYLFDLCFLVPTTHVILIIGVPSCNLFHLCESTLFPILNKITTNFF